MKVTGHAKLSTLQIYIDLASQLNKESIDKWERATSVLRLLKLKDAK